MIDIFRDSILRARIKYYEDITKDLVKCDSLKGVEVAKGLIG